MELKKGDRVKITDGSYAVRVDEFEARPSIGLCMDDFIVVGCCGDSLQAYNGMVAHDIFIQNTVSKRVYLHTSWMVMKVINKCACCGHDLIVY